MKRACFSFFVALPLLAGVPSNTVTLRWSGGAEAGHPVTIARPFAKGEIRDFAKPLLNGVEPSYWQNDQVRRWRDGVSTCTITSVNHVDPLQVTCPNHGFRSGDWVTLSTQHYKGRYKIVYWTRDKFLVPGIEGIPASRNFLPSREAWDNWIGGLTATPNATDDPGGNRTAEKIAEQDRSGYHNLTVIASQLNRFQSGRTYTFSVYLKAAERNHAGVYYYNETDGLKIVFVNLSTCAVTRNDFGPENASSTPAGNGWCRVAVTITAKTGQTDLGPMLSPDGGTAEYTGTSGYGVYGAWGQLEEGTLTDYEPEPAPETGTATGPGPGSLKWAVISFITGLPTESGDITVTFANSPTRTSDANYTSPTKQQILDFHGGNWNAAIRYEQSGTTTRTVDARTMIQAGHYRLRLDGPAVWEVIAEDRSSAQTYDFGITCSGTGCSGDYSGASWSDDSSSKAVHPYFILRMYRGWPGVQVRYIHEQINSADMRDQRFTITLLTGSGLSATQWSGTYTIYARQRVTWPVDSSQGSWTGDYTGYWDGSRPVPHTMDHNPNYLRYTRQVPFYDTRAVVNDATVSQDWSDWMASSRVPGTGSGMASKDWGAAGYRPDIGLLPRWSAEYLIRPSDNKLAEVATGTSLLMGHAPVHWREFNASYPNFLDLDGDGTSQNDASAPTTTGRMVSIYARPTMTWFNGTDFGGCEFKTAAEGCYYNSHPLTKGQPSLSASHGWRSYQVPLSHAPETGYVAYLLSGDYFLEEELQFRANFAVFGANTERVWAGYKRHDSTAWMGAHLSTRSTAWGLRELLFGYEISPDGSPEKEYLYSLLNSNLQIIEGVLKIANGDFWNPTVGGTPTNPCPNFNVANYTPSTYTPYCHGAAGVAGGFGNGSLLGIPMLHPTGGGGENGRYCWSTETDLNVGYACDSTFSMWYLYQVLGMADQLLGIPAIAERVARWPIGLVLHPDANPYWVTSYSIPVADGNGMLSTFARMRASMNDFFKTRSSFNDSYVHAQDGIPWNCQSYAGDFRSALSFFVAYNPMGMRGTAAWEAWKQIYFVSPNIERMAWDRNVPGASVCSANSKNIPDYSYPNEGISPAFDPVKNVKVTPGDTFVILEYTKPREDEACTVNGVSDGVTNSRSVRFVLTGLTPLSSGTATITCASDPYGDTTATWTTSAVLDGTAQYRWKLQGRSRIWHGASPENLDSVTPFEDCSYGCTAAVPRGLRYMRVEREGGLLGPVRPVAVR